MKPLWLISNGTARPAGKNVVYLQPTRTQRFAIVQAACSGYTSPIGATIFVFRVSQNNSPTLYEVAFDGYSSTPADLTTATPIASAIATGDLGYFWIKPGGIAATQHGFVAHGVAYGPQGQTLPVSDSKMYPAQLEFRWNGTYFVLANTSGIVSPPLPLLGT
jgi:hypothetical protein